MKFGKISNGKIKPDKNIKGIEIIKQNNIAIPSFSEKKEISVPHKQLITQIIIIIFINSKISKVIGESIKKKIKYKIINCRKQSIEKNKIFEKKI